MAKPTTIPVWATSGTVVEPPAGKKLVGWLVNDKAPAEFMNWLQKHAGLWFQWLNDFESTQHTWAETQTMNGSAGDTNAALLFAAVPDTRKLEQQLGLAGTNAKGRVYRLANGTLELTSNAVWNGTAWARDNNSYGAGKVTLDPVNGVRHFSQVSGSSTWADSAWLAGEVQAVNTAKAWGSVRVSGGTATVQSGSFNVDSVTADVSGVTVTLDNDMDGTGYALHLTDTTPSFRAGGNVACIATSTAKAEGSFSMCFMNPATDIPRTISSGDWQFDFVIYGQQ